MPSLTASDGVRLDYVESGDPAGRPILLIAGFTAAATSWRYQVGPLGSAGFRMLALDLRGHGTSGHPSTGLSMARRADDLRDFLEALDLEDVVLIGGSMGGNTIWAYLGAHGSEAVSQVVVIDQTPKMLNAPGWPYGFYGYTEAERDTLFARGVPSTGHGTPMQRRGRRLVRMLGAMDAGPALLKALTSKKARELPPADLELLHDHATADWREVIAAQTIPALFVAGRESEVWPCEHAAAAAALNPLATSIVIEEAGHATNMEQPDLVNLAVLEFLGPRVRAGGPADSGADVGGEG